MPNAEKILHIVHFNLDAHILEPNEYNDRMRMYQHRLAQQWNKLPANGSAGELSTSTRRSNRKMIKNEKLFEGFLLKDIPNPENVLSSTPIPADDVNMVSICYFLRWNVILLLHFICITG